MGKAVYYIVYFILYLISLLPFRALYALSDFLFFWLFHILKYRKKIVLNNLKNSFPHKSAYEIEQIARKFYHHFCDLIVEVVKMINMSQKQSLTRMKILNPELFEHYYRQNKHVLVVLGHYGNWEWLNNSPLYFPSYHYICIYKPLKNKHFDSLFNRLRSKFGARPAAMHHIFRELFRLSNQQIYTATAFVADQTPTYSQIGAWMPFLNQDTAVFSGVERIARKIDSVIVFGYMEKVKRGFYQVKLVSLCENPSEFNENEITAMHLRALEEMIVNKPELWLWTHKRWKHNKEEWLKNHN